MTAVADETLFRQQNAESVDSEDAKPGHSAVATKASNPVDIGRAFCPFTHSTHTCMHMCTTLTSLCFLHVGTQVSGWAVSSWKQEANMPYSAHD